MSRITRRRFLSVVGASAGLALASGPLAAAPQRVRWTGTAMGAQASITLYHVDPVAARALIAECVDAIGQVEAMFSAFRRDSLLVRLNREGRVDKAPPAFLDLVARAQDISALSDGAFDVTVQPLWNLYAGHFSRSDADPAGPSPAAIDAARSRVGWRDLIIDGETVAFNRPGMAATFNGIAQGYVTDRVAELMRARGMTNILLDLGEMRAMGTHADGRPWRVGIADPLAPAAILEGLDLRDQAVASSGGYGTKFDGAGRFHHLFDPSTGRPSTRWAGITVIAPTATAADALTKAVALAPRDRAIGILRAGGGIAALRIAPDRGIERLNA